MADEISKIPPQNIDAEKAVLAAMILDKDVVIDALAIIQAEAFYRNSHQKIYSAIAELSERNDPVDMLSLADRLEARGDLDSVGGKAYIAELANNSFALYNWENHAEIVKRQALLRSLVNAAYGIEKLGFSSIDDADEAVEAAEKLLFEATEKRIGSSFLNIKELLDEAFSQLEEMAENRSHILGVPSGFADLDRLLAGFRGGDLIVLAARPSVGKSALALNMAINAAREGVTVAVFSLEMPAAQLAQRLISAEGGVDSNKMRTANLNKGDWKTIIDTCNRLAACDVFIDDTPALSLLELRAKARRQLHGVSKGLIVVDYLQLMHSRGAQKDRWLEVGEISRGLKVLAKELNVPIIALSQLSRGVEARKDKRPMLSDLRESGSIEQDADVVLFIDRSLSEDEAATLGRPDNGMAKLIVGKNRNGAVRDIDLVFDGSFTRFRDFHKDPLI